MTRRLRRFSQIVLCASWKRMPLVFVALCLCASITFAWLTTDPPQGHIETAGFADGKILLSTQMTLTTLMGTAHKGGTDQADANTRIDRYEIDLWYDTNAVAGSDAGDARLAWVGNYVWQVNGGAYNAVGWDVSAANMDDGTEGDLLQGQSITFPRPGRYLMRLVVYDVNTNSTQMVASVDRHADTGDDALGITGDGRAAVGLGDPEVVDFVVNAPAGRP